MQNPADTLYRDLSEGRVSVLQVLTGLRLFWQNDFLTVARFSEYAGLSEDDGRALIELARKAHGGGKG